MKPVEDKNMIRFVDFIAIGLMSIPLWFAGVVMAAYLMEGVL